MGQLEDAQKRLERAIARLEDAAAQAAGANAAGEDPRRLEAALSDVRERCQALEWQSQEVSRRLDGAIARLRAILNDGDGAS